MNKQRRKFQRTYSDELLRQQRKTEYFKLKHLYAKKLKDEKLKTWIDFCNSVNGNPWNAAYKIAAGKLKAQPILSTIQKSDGTFTNGLQET